MKRRSFTSLMIASALALSGASGAARAEAQEVRISHGYGLLYLPLMVMRDQGLVEKHAKAMGLGDVKTSGCCSMAATSSMTPCWPAIWISPAPARRAS